jgi:integrase
VRGPNKALTAKAAERLTRPGRYAVGSGAYLQISQRGTKAWLFRYQRDGKARQMGLGAYDLVTLAEARAKAVVARKALLEGHDPLEVKAARRAYARLEAAKGLTFRDCAERMISSHEAAWKNPKHRAQWRSTLATYCYPTFGDLAVADVDTGLVLKSLEPLWTAKPETAGRVRGRIESVLDWAKARGYRDGENPARWRGHLDKLLPNRRRLRRVRNHPAMPYADVPALMAELRGRESMSAKALEFMILCAARTGEIIGARWPEFDLRQRIWTLPAERMKAGKEHRVPLSDRALEALKSLPRESEFIFVGGKFGRPLSNMAMLELLRGMRPGSGYVPHGFRSSFRDWVSERTGYASEVAEAALAHAIESKVEAAYRRSDLFEKRRRLMEEWASFCYGAADQRSSVIPLRRTEAFG